MLQVMQNINRFLVHEKTVPESQFPLRSLKPSRVCSVGDWHWQRKKSRFHVRGGHLAAISCSVDEKIPDHSCRCEFYDNRSALIEIVPLEEGQLNHAGKDPSATCRQVYLH